MLVAPVTPTDAGSLLLQVSGTPVIVIPSVSVTVAFRVVDAPVLTTKELDGFPNALIEMDCTGHVVNATGWLFTPSTLAKIEVVPGTFAVAVCRLKHCPWLPRTHCGLPTEGVDKETGVDVPGARLCQVNGPTEAVISVAPLEVTL